MLKICGKLNVKRAFCKISYVGAKTANCDKKGTSFYSYLYTIISTTYTSSYKQMRQKGKMF